MIPIVDFFLYFQNCFFDHISNDDFSKECFEKSLLKTFD